MKRFGLATLRFSLGFALWAALLSGCGGARKEPEGTTGKSAVAEQVGDIALLHLEVPAFSELSDDQKRAAYYLSKAVLAGRNISCNQINSRSSEIRFFLEGIRLHATYAAPEYYVKPFDNYLKAVWIHGGFYDLATGVKVPPQIGERELSQLMFLALANSGGQLGSLLDINLKSQYILDTLFNPSLDSTLFFPVEAAPPAFVLNFPQGFYGQVGIPEALAFPSKYPRNSRLVMRADGLREIPCRVGDDELAPGLFAAELEGVIENLENARPYLPPSRVAAVDLLIEHLRTGQPSAYDSAAAIWRSRSAQVDFILGFGDSRFDPLGNKSLWTGLLFVPDDYAQARLDRVQEMVGELAAELPAGVSLAFDPNKKIRTAQLLTGIGVCGPLCPDVYRDPPGAAKESPRLSVIFTNLVVARARAEAALASHPGGSDSALATQYAGEVAFAENVLREVFDLYDEGAGLLRSRPSEAPRERIVAVQRELILLEITYNPKLIQIGLLFNPAAQQEAYQRFARQYLNELTETQLDMSQLARRVIGSDLITAGVLKIDEINGRQYCRVVDGDLMQGRISALLAEIGRMRNAPDPQRAAAEFLARYPLGEPQVAVPRQTRISARPSQTPPPSKFAFIMPLVEADFNPMGGIGDVHLRQPADFAEEMFLWGGHKRELEKP